MRFCRFLDGGPHYGLIETRNGRDVIARVASSLDGLGLKQVIQSPPHEPVVPIPIADVQLLAPVMPSKIVCVGRNYKDHASELGNEVPKEPLLFLKPPSSITAPGAVIHRPTGISQRVDFEGELGIVIGRRCRDLREDEDPCEYILGYTCVNDVTARDLQKKDGQWARAKGFDTFCPVGPIVSNEVDPWAGVEVTTTLNGETKQRGNTREFIFSIEKVLRYISQVMTLYPGDLIPTGTPAGVAPMNAGDVVEVTIQGIGTLRNTVT